MAFSYWTKSAINWVTGEVQMIGSAIKYTGNSIYDAFSTNYNKEKFQAKHGRDKTYRDEFGFWLKILYGTPKLGMDILGGASGGTTPVFKIWLMSWLVQGVRYWPPAPVFYSAFYLPFLAMGVHYSLMSRYPKYTAKVIGAVMRNSNITSSILPVFMIPYAGGLLIRDYFDGSFDPGSDEVITMNRIYFSISLALSGLASIPLGRYVPSFPNRILPLEKEIQNIQSAPNGVHHITRERATLFNEYYDHVNAPDSENDKIKYAKKSLEDLAFLSRYVNHGSIWKFIAGVTFTNVRDSELVAFIFVTIFGVVGLCDLIAQKCNVPFAKRFDVGERIVGKTPEDAIVLANGPGGLVVRNAFINRSYTSSGEGLNPFFVAFILLFTSIPSTSMVVSMIKTNSMFNEKSTKPEDGKYTKVVSVVDQESNEKIFQVKFHNKPSSFSPDENNTFFRINWPWKKIPSNEIIKTSHTDASENGYGTKMQKA